MDNLPAQNEVLWEVLLQTREKLAKSEQEVERLVQLHLAMREEEKRLCEELFPLRNLSATFDTLKHELFSKFNLDTTTGLKALLAPGVVDVTLLNVQHAALKGEEPASRTLEFGGFIEDKTRFIHPLLAAPRIITLETTPKQECSVCGFFAHGLSECISSDPLDLPTLKCPPDKEADCASRAVFLKNLQSLQKPPAL